MNPPRDTPPATLPAADSNAEPGTAHPGALRGAWLKGKITRPGGVYANGVTGDLPDNTVRVRFDVTLPRHPAARLALLAAAVLLAGVFAANQVFTLLRHVGVLTGCGG